jgi:predicted glycogen debranching enzyme
LDLFQKDPGTDAVLMLGEIGGSAEEEAAAYFQKSRIKPLFAFIAGRTAPPGKRMGHAGAIIEGAPRSAKGSDRPSSGSADSKRAALTAAGVRLIDSPADMGETLLRALKVGPMREWLETNGRGGYALGSESGGAVRRYHGLLTAALKPPLSRFQLVNRLEETVRTPGGSVALSRQSYPGVAAAVAPELSSFRINTFPTWTFSVGDSEIEKSFFLRYGEDTGLVTYRLRAGPPVNMEIRPLLSFRDHHAVGRQDDRFEGRWTSDQRGFCVNTTTPYPLSVWSTAGSFFQDPHWYVRQRYEEEEQRGLECEEDVWGPGSFRFSLTAGSGVSVVFSAVHGPDTAVDRWEEEERDQRHRVAKTSLARGPLGNALTMAADSFIVSRGSGASVIAGYPWFGDWSRDALVSFPGLFLATGRWREAPGLLDTFARHARQGLLPNFFPEGSASVAYNAVDAPLWFVRAVQAYHRVTHDDAAVRRWLPVMRDMVDAFQNGAGYHIHMDGDGLIVAPAADVALTWMDARVDGRPVTPRAGKPVEIQACGITPFNFWSKSN